MFPRISHLDDILPHIAGLEHIQLFKRDDHYTLDYTYSSGPSSFPNPHSLECRGLKFNLNGHIIARPFHKFFNLGETNTNPDFTREHEVLVKLDGSMIHAVHLNGTTRFMTRMGITDISRQAELLFPEILKKCSSLLDRHITPIFEYTGPENRIVLRYDRSELTLLAAREFVSGRYLNRTELTSIVNELSGTLVAPYTGPLERVPEVAGIEGVVIAFPDGFRTKLKARDYVLRHRARDNLHRERHVLTLILNNGHDDLLPLLPHKDAQALLTYQQDVDTFINHLTTYILNFRKQSNNLPRKEYALKVKGEPRWIQPLLFSTEEYLWSVITSYLLRHCARTSHLKEFAAAYRNNPIFLDNTQVHFPSWSTYYIPYLPG